jgi:uncharacterized membrane protein
MFLPDNLNGEGEIFRKALALVNTSATVGGELMFGCSVIVATMAGVSWIVILVAMTQFCVEVLRPQNRLAPIEAMQTNQQRHTRGPWR